jgi:hypothetical protein
VSNPSSSKNNGGKPCIVFWKNKSIPTYAKPIEAIIMKRKFKK